MNRKTELNTQRNAAIFRDFANLYIEGKMRVGAIYEELEAKYFLDRKTIERIISKAKTPKKDNSISRIEGVP
jgi:Mor family transcriptional regulator